MPQTVDSDKGKRNNNNSNNNNEPNRKRCKVTNNNNNNNSDNIESNHKDCIMKETTKTKTTKTKWGEWMGSWKVDFDQIDHEAERIDRQKAAFGGETISRLKDLNVLVIGCQGVGVETSKNLILSNVGGVLVYDPYPCTIADRGTNFYITETHIQQGISRAKASISELQTLNPFCKVDTYEDSSKNNDNNNNDDVNNHNSLLEESFLLSKNVLNTHRPLAAVVVTSLGILSKKDLFQLNQLCRNHKIAFVLACTHGVTTSLFSDFGPIHEISDATGEPTQTLAISNMEVLTSKPNLLQVQGVANGSPIVIVTVAQAEHGLDDGDCVTLDDMRGELQAWNGKQLKVKRVAILSPVRVFCFLLLLLLCVSSCVFGFVFV